MLSKQQRSEIGARIQKAIGEKARTQIAREADKAGYELSPKAIYNWIAGRSLPNAEGLIAFCLATNTSPNYILFGENQEMPTWDELLSNFEHLAAAHGLRMQRDAPWIREFIQKLRELEAKQLAGDEQQQLLLGLINQFLTSRAEKAK